MFFNTLTVYDKHYLLNRDMLTEPIQVQLSEKQKKFSEFCFAFSKSILNFKHLPKKMTLMYFPKNRFPKTCLDEWLKSLVSYTLRQTTRKMGRNTLAISMTAPLQYLLFTVKVVPLEEVSCSDTQNRRTVC